MATAGALFMYLADEIGEQARLTQVDLAVAQFFHNHGTPWAVRLFAAITFFGNLSTLGAIGLVTALVLAFHSPLQKELYLGEPKRSVRTCAKYRRKNSAR